MISSYFNKTITKMHNKFMRQRFDLLLNVIDTRKGDLIVDLGGGNGEFMELFGEEKSDYEILIADISKSSLKEARKKGFKTLLLKESDPLPFNDQEVDVIFCNSVIEHCTIAKSSMWTIIGNDQFKDKALKAQFFFAQEIERVSKSYFVQTPNISFPIESHSLFPFAAKLSRPYQISLIKFLNKFWVKKTSPDWNLLTKSDMESLFPNGNVIEKKWLGFSKEIITYRNGNFEKIIPSCTKGY